MQMQPKKIIALAAIFCALLLMGLGLMLVYAPLEAVAEGLFSTAGFPLPGIMAQNAAYGLGAAALLMLLSALLLLRGQKKLSNSRFILIFVLAFILSIITASLLTLYLPADLALN